MVPFVDDPFLFFCYTYVLCTMPLMLGMLCWWLLLILRDKRKHGQGYTADPAMATPLPIRRICEWQSGRVTAEEAATLSLVSEVQDVRES
jgi:hypothetical protein